MKRYIVFAVVVLLMATWVQANFLGVKKASETIAFPVHPPLDSAGIPHAPDSIQVIAYGDDDATAAYKATGAAYACAGIDTTMDYGSVLIWFNDQIQDIDDNGGNFELAIDVVAWAHLLPTHTFATVQVISDSLENLMTACRDSSSSAAVLAKNDLDSLQAQDGWLASEASVLAARDTASLAHKAAHEAGDSAHAGVVAALTTPGDSTKSPTLFQRIYAAWSIGKDARDTGSLAHKSALDARDTGHAAVLAALTAPGDSTKSPTLYQRIYNSWSMAKDARDTGSLAHKDAHEGLDSLKTLADAVYDTVARVIYDSTVASATLVDNFWDEDTTGHKTAPNMGYYVATGGSSTFNPTTDSVMAKAQVKGIDANVITTASVKDGAFTNAKFADSVFDEGNLMGGLLDAIAARILADSTYFASTEDIWRNIDTAGSIDTSALGAWLVANVTASGAWSTVQRDSVLAALANAGIFAKVWTGDSNRVVWIKDTTKTGRRLSIMGYQPGPNLVKNGEFEMDTVANTTAPTGWTEVTGTYNANCKIRTEANSANHWFYRLYQTVAISDSFVLATNVGTLYPGYYLLSADIRAAISGVGNYRGWIAIDSGAASGAGADGYEDSLVFTENTVAYTTLMPRSKIVHIVDSGQYCVSVGMKGTIYDDIDFDNVRLIPLTTEYVTSTPANSVGDT
ncbi:MAG: hypothetical protein PHG25_04425, partial [Candidatus Pacebacteria bacterium]|nr:hypothetical protein [Candidatus Paceibacterota bacterium]